MKNRGQLEISFGMIFSIILIIAFVGTAFYVITYFLNMKNCTEIGIFYNGLKERVNEAWAGTAVQTAYTGILPGGIKKVCFGNTTLVALTDSLEEYKTAGEYFDAGDNIFLFPIGKTCETRLGSQKLQHVVMDNFFCVDVVKGKVSVRLSKTSSESLVRLSK